MGSLWVYLLVCIGSVTVLGYGLIIFYKAVCEWFNEDE